MLMKRSCYCLLLSWLLVTNLAAQQRPREPKATLPEAGFVHLPLIVKSIPTLKVRVNGTELLLGIDTGCQGAGVLTPEALERAGMEIAMSVPSMGNTGRNQTDYALVETLEMGEGTWRDFHIAVLPLTGSGLDGLIGAEILFTQGFYMDLADRVMVLGKIPDTSGAREVSCFSRGGHVNINLDIDGRKVPMLIDSGATLSYVTSMKYRGKVAFRGYAPVATVRGLSLQKMEVCLPETVMLQGVPLNDVTFHRGKEHNILGNDFLRAHPIAVDRAARRLWLFEPLVNKPRPKPKAQVIPDLAAPEATPTVEPKATPPVDEPVR